MDREKMTGAGLAGQTRELLADADPALDPDAMRAIRLLWPHGVTHADLRRGIVRLAQECLDFYVSTGNPRLLDSACDYLQLLRKD